MITARTFVRFVFAGLFVNAMAVACVVSDGDDDDDDSTACDPGSYKDCTCANGDAGQKKCSASGNGYGACACEGDNVGGGGSGGEPSTTAGTTSNNYGGEGGTGTGGAGGDNSGGMMSVAGAGGAETDPDAVCIESAEDDCLDCMQLDCCEAWKACSAETEGDCQQQAYDIMLCATNTERGPDDGEAEVTPEELEDCAQDIAENDVWSAGVLPTTKAVIDCVAGGQGWAAKTDLSASSCESLCFIATE
jgi:hypothetical protein